MPDMIVSLHTLPETPDLDGGIRVEPARPWDREVILDWVSEHFSRQWASEVACGLGQHPSRVLIARQGEQLLGFACFDVTFPGFFGPTGVIESARGQGLGKALLLEALAALKAQGYVYAFIGDPGPVAFYQKTVGAVSLPESVKGSYDTPLRFIEKGDR